MSALLQVTDLACWYGAVQALFGVDIQVPEGQVVALLGGNASGKSSLIRAALGLTTRRRGSVRFDGREFVSLATHQIIDLGLGSIPEGRRVFGSMSVRENLLMGAYPRRREAAAAVRRDIDDALDAFPRLAQRWAQPAGSLSGGEQQMLALARAWVRKPRLLCIDEPSMGLSPLMVEEVYQVLRRWKAQGTTLLMVDQNADLALSLADHAYVLQNGLVVLSGAAHVLRNQPAVVQAYLGGSSAQQDIRNDRGEQQ